MDPVAPPHASVWHARFRIFLMVALSLLTAGAFALRWADVTMPRRSGFMTVMVIVIGCNLIWWTYADAVLVGWPMGRRRRAALRAVLALAVLAMCAWPIDMLLTGRVVQLVNPPTWTVSAFQLWSMGLVIGLPIAMLIVALLRGLIWLIGRAVRRVRSARVPAGEANSTVALDYSPGDAAAISRRQWLTAAGIYAPVVLVGGATAYGGRQNGRFEINRHDVPAPWLPERLRGLTITHVTDLHLGRFYRPAFLPRLVEETNRLGSDLILMTGDLLDSSNDLIPPLVAALGQLRARHGMYLCVGNHDLIDDGAVFKRALRSEGFNLLLNERRAIDIGGERLTLAGLDWARSDQAAFGRPSHASCAHAALDGHDPHRDGPAIALAHHPHAFDATAAAGVPLTLAGHTHGGQLMWNRDPRVVKRSAESDHGAGRLLFRYVRGFYERDGKRLFISNGVGNWFPIRVNAPAEIVQLRLV